MKSLIYVAVALAAVCTCQRTLAYDITFTSTDPGNAMPIVADNAAAIIITSAADKEVVATAAECLASDLEAVTGVRPALHTSLTAAPQAIIAGTIGHSPLIDALASSGKIDITGIQGKWEVFSHQIVDNPAEGIDRALVVCGSTPRGTAYGLLELSRLAGVSPYIWWADVKPESKSTLYASGDLTISREPSVKYRGIFINDEDFCLFPWAKNGIDKKYQNIGPNTYSKVMELLLRLRANTLWPAMHLCSEAFWANKDNLPVAKKYDIVLGTSHCEQMLRDNEWEWRHEPWNGNNEDWNYVTNTKKIQKYWAERVGESRGFSAMYTLGMRGVHDWGISGYPSTEDKVRGLTEIIAFQRQLLADSIGDPTTVPQIFIPYKEVLEAYNAGLKVPDDVTLTWVDDNHGYIRQMPRASEQARSGGNGIYYHLSYWGTPSDYLWLCSTAPALISYQLCTAYNNGVRDLWIINVGDIKPAEAELEFCMDLAWDIDRWQPEAAHDYMREWAARTFGEEFADDIAEIKETYYRLGSGGKPEHVFNIAYTNADKENRLAEYAQIANKVDMLKARIPADLRDAYFQLVEYPVKGAYNMNTKIFRAAQSLEMAKAGQRDKAIEYSREAREAFEAIKALTNYYNTTLAGGKWNGMMDYKPRNLSQFEMPRTATHTSVAPFPVEVTEQETVTIPASDFIAKSGNFEEIEGLGIGRSAMAVWPLDMTAYTARAISKAPSLTYKLPVKKGTNTISARCVPNFPLNTGYDLRVAISIDGATAKILSLKTVAMEGKWHTTVMQGFNDATVEYASDSDKEITLKVSFMDPCVVLSDIRVVMPEIIDLALTESLLTNYDFELRSNGTPNPAGNIDRGIPYGWSSTGTLNLGANGNKSYGVNQDAANPHGSNVCWINSVPMPAEFALYQTVPAEKLEPGIYKVSCLLWVEENKKTNCRLFANNSVQYYGYESDYSNLLNPSETATYAGYAGQNGSGPFNLMPMSVYVAIAPGEDLTLGIKSGNRRNDGTSATDNAGWFKTDFFRIERISDLDGIENLTVTELAPTDSIFDLNGRLVTSLHNLPAGIYVHNGKKVRLR